MLKTRRGLGLAGVVVLGVIGTLGALGPVAFVERESAAAWMERVARVDDALGRSELDRAVDEWRKAYDAALRSGRSEGLVAVGDRAVRIAALAGGSSSFRTEARNVYVHAALRAGAERSPATILALVERLERLGDPDRADQMRQIATRLV
jgi:hypothetical protein